LLNKFARFNSSGYYYSHASRLKMTTPSTRMRCRRVLDSLSSQDEAALRKLLPRGTITDKSIGALPNGKFPSGLHSVLPDGEGYSIIGHVGEALLHRGADDISVDLLLELVAEHCELDAVAVGKVRKSKTTEPFLEAVRSTRRLLDPLFEAVPGEVLAEPTLEGEHFEGHPDLVVGLGMTQAHSSEMKLKGAVGQGRTATGEHVFEIKCAGRPKESWSGFLYQAFAYAALLPSAAKLSIVLPLQSYVWTFDLAKWPQADRKAYKELMEAAAVKAMTVGADVGLAAAELVERCCVGSHIEKKAVMGAALASLDSAKPWQIFLSGNRNSSVNIKPAELALTRRTVDATGTKVFVHSPYLINLCSPPGEKEDYHVGCLKKCLDAAAAMGFHGVVVHVGKSLKMDLGEALENMRWAIQQCLPHATETCPLLLETPAGQGTEVLTDLDQFVEFVASLADRRFRICVDTCHVFATGYEPLEYIEYIQAVDPDLLRLVHFNDSETPCGARVDRHAACGMGHIGLEKMTAVAEHCLEGGVPALIE
jgi:deoxyribonuclease-4